MTEIMSDLSLPKPEEFHKEIEMAEFRLSALCAVDLRAEDISNTWARLRDKVIGEPLARYLRKPGQLPGFSFTSPIWINPHTGQKFIRFSTMINNVDPETFWAYAPWMEYQSVNTLSMDGSQAYYSGVLRVAEGNYMFQIRVDCDLDPEEVQALWNLGKIEMTAPEPAQAYASIVCDL